MNEQQPKPYIFTHCFRKIRFANEAEAEREAQRLRQRYPATTKQLRSYSCEFCAGWHVGKVVGSGND